MSPVQESPGPLTTNPIKSKVSLREAGKANQEKMTKEAVNSDASELNDPFKMIRNNFNFAFVCEFLNNFSSAFFSGPDDVLPTSPVKLIKYSA